MVRLQRNKKDKLDAKKLRKMQKQHRFGGGVATLDDFADTTEFSGRKHGGGKMAEFREAKKRARSISSGSMGGLDSLLGGAGGGSAKKKMKRGGR